MDPLPFRNAPSALIDGVIVKRLRPIPDERGRLMEILRADDPFFDKFGQVYMTTVFPGVVKAWHLHRRQTDHLAVLVGTVRLGLYDPREGSPTRGLVNEFFPGEHDPMLVRVPVGVLHGIKGVGTREALVLNVPSEPYDPICPDELRLAPDDPSVPFDWTRRDG
jgi:dTDP-4-dehydrorhamnose 3,5-epimerase